MKTQWKSLVLIAALALSMGLAAPAWSQPALADPMLEEYSAHVIPFYKIDDNWSAFLVVSDTSHQDLDPDGSSIHINFYKATCHFASDAIVELTQTDAQYFALHDGRAAAGQFAGIPEEGVVLLSSEAPPPTPGPPAGPPRFLTYVLLVNGNDNSLIRIDSIPCQGQGEGANARCSRTGPGNGTWLRYDTYNTVAATFGDSGGFRTNLYFFSAPEGTEEDPGVGDLRAELLRYGQPRHGEWAERIHLDGWCDEIYLGSRVLDLKCTQRLGLKELNFTNLNDFPNEFCSGKPGHIETFAISSDNAIDVVEEDYSGFQETIACLVPPTNLIGTGYLHHREVASGPDLAAP